MSKDPAFLFYPGDWDGGTKLFDRHTKGKRTAMFIMKKKQVEELFPIKILEN